MKNITKLVSNYKTKYKQGFTNNEIKQICDELSISHDAFYEALGVHTAVRIDEDIVTYHTDVIMALNCTI